jgi:hypothetical protein
VFNFSHYMSISNISVVLNTYMLYTLQMSDLMTMEAMAEHENQKKMSVDLQSRLEEAEQQIMDGERLRRKLHNTILVIVHTLKSDNPMFIVISEKYFFAGAEGKY